MFVRPDHLSDRDIAEALTDGWGVRADVVQYAAVGFGSHHWHVAAGGMRWFATLDDLASKRRSASDTVDDAFARLDAALRTAVALRSSGLDFVVAPLPTTAGDVLHRLSGRDALALYPHVAGRTHEWGPFEHRHERVAVIDLLAVLHTAPEACRRRAGVEGFDIVHGDALLRALDEVEIPWSAGPFGERARELLQTHRQAVIALIARHGALADIQRRRPDRYVVTHGEPHRGNTITTTVGPVLIDWDTVLVAPPERDLWSLVLEDGSIADAYRTRTDVAVDADAVEFYRLAWDLSEIAIYTNDFRHDHGDTADTRTAWSGLRDSLDRNCRRTP